MATRNTENNEKEWNIKKDIVTPILIAFIVAGISIPINMKIWKMQYRIEYNDKVLDKKVGVFNDVTESIFKCEHLLKNKFEYDNLFNYYSEPNKDRTVEDIARIDDLIITNRPYVFEKYLEYLDFKADFSSILSISKLYFGDEVGNAIDEFKSSVLDKDYFYYLSIYEEYALNEIKMPKGKLYPNEHEIFFETGLLMESFSKYIEPYTYNILSKMQEEIKNNYNKH